MKTEITVRPLTLADFSSGQAFYGTVGYSSPIQADDRVIGAFNHEGLIGIVRLTHENGVQVLRGLQINPVYQRRGLGTKMLAELAQFIDRDCYCVPHDWLEGFYGQIGFARIGDTEAPGFLRERLVEYKVRYPHLIVMRRGISESPH